MQEPSGLVSRQYGSNDKCHKTVLLNRSCPWSPSLSCSDRCLEGPDRSFCCRHCCHHHCHPFPCSGFPHSIHSVRYLLSLLLLFRRLTVLLRMSSLSVPRDVWPCTTQRSGLDGLADQAADHNQSQDHERSSKRLRGPRPSLSQCLVW